MNSNDARPLATIRLHPFAIVIGVLAIVIVGPDLWTLDFDWATLPVLQNLGRGLVVLGVLTLILAYGTMARARTPIDPRQHTTTIVSTGIYRLSRNPIYINMAILQAALGLLVNNMWTLLMIIPVLIVIHYLVVLREEVYLEAKFGDAYLDYKSRVRRWI